MKPSLFMFEVLLGSLALLALYMCLPYLLALIMGLIMAILFSPYYNWLRKKNIGPNLSSLIVVISLLFTIVAPLTFLAVASVKQAIAIEQRMTANDDYSISALSKKISAWGPAKSFIDDPQTFEGEFKDSVESAAKKISSAVLVQAGAVPDILLQLALMLLACFFLLIDGKRLGDWISEKLPLDTKVQKTLKTSFQNTSAAVIRATFAAAGVQAIIVALGFLVLGVPAVALATGAAFILAWIPVLGCSPVWIVGALYLYVNKSLTFALLMVAVGLLAGVADNIVRPFVLKGKADLHPLVSLVAVFGGIHVFGLLGVFMGPILADALIILINTWPSVVSRSKEIK